MNRFIDKLLKYIYSKRKQIIFALFALVCIILDKNDSLNILKAGAPAIVAAGASAAKTTAGAAKVASTASAATSSGTSAAAAGGSAATSSGASAAATGGSATTSSGTSVSSKAIASNSAKGSTTISSTNNTSTTSLNSLSNGPKNTNPSGVSNSMSINGADLKTSNNMDIDTTKTAQKQAGVSDVEAEGKKSKKSSMNRELNDDEESEEETTLDEASNEITKNNGSLIIGCLLGSFLIFIMLIGVLFVTIINPSTSIMSQINCSLQENTYCDEESDSGGFFNKLANLFTYGVFGTNNEVIVKKITEVYEQIKAEYDFIISIPLLTSSMFSDAEYSKTDVENEQVVITDEMVERVKYTYDMAFLQLIPRFHIYTCNAHVIDEDEYSKSYQYTTEDEEAVIGIPTGECDASTAGGTYKEITYFFDEEKYFKRLEPSEELDLVYANFEDDEISDEILLNKIKNHYYIYKSINKMSDVAEYDNAPIHLEYDESVNLQTPLKGDYVITSPFGEREGEFAGMHNGIDLVSDDKNIYSAGIGIVTRSNVETEGGNVIEITHTDKNGVQYVTQYAHLSVRLVNVGDIVNAGDVIGIMGSTGTMSSGVHLHFSMWKKEPYELLNPRKMFSNASNY